MRYILCIFFLASKAFTANFSVKYEPEIVELQGVLELRIYPGPPNFESVKLGDKSEKCYYLKLVDPIDVFPISGANDLINDVVEKNVKLIQLSIRNDRLFQQFKKIDMGKQIKLRGTLFHRHTGHHHTEVLMSVDDIAKK